MHALPEELLQLLASQQSAVAALAYEPSAFHGNAVVLCDFFQTKLVTFCLRHLAAGLEQFHAHCCQNQALSAAAVTAAVTVAVIAALTAAEAVAEAVAVGVAGYIVRVVAGQAVSLSVVLQLLP